MPVATCSQKIGQNSHIHEDQESFICDQLGRRLRDLRISIIDQCNFRCPYCMPATKIKTTTQFLSSCEYLPFTEIVRLVKIISSLGVRKIRITGGEPLLRENLNELISHIKKIRDINDIALTTNGHFLFRYAKLLKNAGLNRITVSLDSLNEKIFKIMSGGFGSVKNVLNGIHEAEKVGFKQIKINVVVQKGINEKYLLEIAEYFRGTNHIVRFIEYMDVGTQNDWRIKDVVPSSEIFHQINRVFELEPIESNYIGEVAKRYRYKDKKGEVGFISSVSQPFCRDCGRFRLSPDGKLYECLFADEGVDIKNLIHENFNDRQILETIRYAWKNRNGRYSECRSQTQNSSKKDKKIEMYQIGG